MKKHTFILHDESVNTYGFRMLTSGANLTEFKKNPVMLLNHDSWELPIGRWENIRIEDDKILADAVFDLKDDRAKKVAEKVADDFVRSASIGAWPPLEVSDADTLKLEGQKGVTVTKWTVREASICTIGANHNALVFYDAEGAKVNLSDQKALIQLMDKQKPKLNNKMNELKSIALMIGLKDNASVENIASEVQNLIKLKDELEVQKTELQGKLDKIEADKKEVLKKEAVELVDNAIKAGILNASGKEAMLKLFDADHEAGKQALGAMPKPVSITEKIKNADEQFNARNAWEKRFQEIEEQTQK